MAVSVSDRAYAVEYRRWLHRYSDVRDHLRTFVSVVTSKRARRVVELGSRRGTSTVAWLFALAQTDGELWTVDLAPAPSLPPSLRWHHVQGDDLDPEVLDQLPAFIEVLFIDTSHDYAHTLAELHAYVPRVVTGGVVLLHDTDLEHPDGIEAQAPFPVRRALDAFCADADLTWTNTPTSFGLGRIDVP